MHKKPHSQQTKNRIGKIMKEIWEKKMLDGYVFSKSRNDNISKAHMGKKLSDKHCIGIAQSKYGKRKDLCNRWKGGRHLHQRGYMLVYWEYTGYYKSPRYKMEHRLVMEEHLGRPLGKEEIVHHINGNKIDNRLENLMLFNNKSEHVKYHRKEGQWTRQR